MPIQEFNPIVIDVDRPDNAEQKPKMWKIALAVEEALELPYMKVKCNDNIMSSVDIFCSLDKKEDWPHKIYLNSRHFRFDITPAKDARYYNEGEKVTVEMEVNGLDCKRMRKATTTPEKAIQKIKTWIEKNC